LDDWLQLEIVVLLDYIVIAAQPPASCGGCVESLSMPPINRKKMAQWLKQFPRAMNETGDAPGFKRVDGRCM
jgi:toxic protein SymE